MKHQRLNYGFSFWFYILLLVKKTAPVKYAQREMLFSSMYFCEILMANFSFPFITSSVLRLAYRYIKNNKDDEKFYPYLYQYVHLLKYSASFYSKTFPLCCVNDVINIIFHHWIPVWGKYMDFIWIWFSHL